ncbi:MAG: flagellar basal-body rod protein FlgF, partial [Deltaproteobacteria bacterium]|nr:flagellar basal-body rod protein FlgF [Deltaproteobacteria bacterium]
GNGFFVVDTPSGPRYTRNGGFSVGKDKTLVTGDGNTVIGEKGAIRLNGADVAIDAEGNIREKGVLVDRLKLVGFNNPGLLRREGAYFTAVSPGIKETAFDKDTQVEQGYREISNVNVVQAMTTMIEALRAYETNSKMIQTLDDMTRKSIEEVGKTA